MKIFLVVLLFILSSFPLVMEVENAFAQAPTDNEIVIGSYSNEEFGFSITFPDGINAFLTEIDNPHTGKIVNIQMHPATLDSEDCCPSIDTSEITILLDSHPLNMLATPVPLTGDIYAALQGYNMNVTIENLGSVQVLVSTVEIERDYLPDYPEPIKRVGKFYFVNTDDDRYLSYGIFASEENYEKYIDVFEESAKTLSVANAKPVDLDTIFLNPIETQIILKGNSAISTSVMSPSDINSVTLDEYSKTFHINITEPNPFRSFLAMDVGGDVFDGPYAATFDGNSIDTQTIENESGKYLLLFYSDEGIHDITISGTNIKSDLSATQEGITDTIVNHNSPLKQMKEGILPKDVICKAGLTLMTRSSGDNIVACVKSESISALTLRGWSAITDIISNNNNHNKTMDIASNTTADIVFKNGAIYTVDAVNPWVEAVAITDKKISFVGDNKNVQSFVSDNTKVIDLEGKMMLPGFHDSHVHPLDMGLALTRCNLFDLSDKELYLEEITKCAQEQSDEKFVIGMGFLLPDYDPYSVTKEDLDVIIPDKPAAFMDMDGHSIWVNSKMLEMSGIDKDTPDPAGGMIIRDPDTGEPTGLFLDDAMFLVNDLFFAIEPEESYEGAKQSLAMMSSGGITSFVEAMTFDGYEELFREMDSNGDLNFRVNLSLWVDPLQDRSEQLEILKEQYSNDKLSHVKANMVKFFIDQGIETQTGSVFEPYYDDDGNLTENYGLLSFEQDDLIFYVTELEKAGFQIHMHAVGDNAIRKSLDALEESQIANDYNVSETKRNTIAHVYLVHPDDVPRFAKLGVMPNYQAFWAYEAEWWYEGIESSLGQERAKLLFPFADLNDAGAKIVLGSDWPVTTYEPLKIIEVGLIRQDPNDENNPTVEKSVLGESQRLDLETMIEAYTINGAYLMQQEDITGSIEVGKYADLVILEKNLFEIEPSEIGEVQVDMTFFEGKQVFNNMDS